jgi:hypothetical protein
LKWSSHVTAQPALTGTTFGTHEFRLTVVDSLGQKAVCTVRHGVVAYDDDGVVIMSNNTPEEQRRNRILGKLIAHGRNPWAWADDRNKRLADHYGTELLSTKGNPFWDVANQGTVSTTVNSTIVTGTGTRFTTDVCGRNGDPALPQFVPTPIVFWYNDTQTPGRIGRFTPDPRRTSSIRWIRRGSMDTG